MADINNCAVIAMAGIAIDQKVTATLGPHMAQSHGCQLSNFVRRHASQHPHSGKTTPSREATLLPACADGWRLNDMGQQDYEMGAVKFTIATSIKALEFGVSLADYHPQRGLSNDPGQVVAAVTQIRDEVE